MNVTQKRILFVDDEPQVLDGLRVSLRAMRSNWEMAFVESGQAALDTMAEAPFDVLVTDMCMPGMDGAELLQHTVDRYPRTARIVLSGRTALEQFLQTVGPAHQFLSKPCVPDTLRDAIERVSAVQDLVPGEELDAIIGKLRKLPDFSENIERLLTELQSSTPSRTLIHQIIADDLGMTGRTIQMVESAFFGLRTEVTVPSQVVDLLGLEFVHSLVLSMLVFSQFEDRESTTVSMTQLWDHSSRVARSAARIAQMEGLEDNIVANAFVGGMLHDVGQLVLDEQLHRGYADILQAASEEERRLWEVERQELSTTHAEVGGYMAGLWELPYAVVEAMIHHHEPSRCPSRKLDALTLVHVANVFDREQHHGGTRDELATSYLKELGLEAKIETWRRACADG